MSYFIKTVIIVCLTVFSLNAQTFPGAFSRYFNSGKSVTVQTTSHGIKISFYSESIARVDLLSSSIPVNDTSLIVIRDTSAAVSYTVTETSNALIIATSELKVAISKNPVRISFYNTSNTLLLSELNAGGIGSNGSSRVAGFNLKSSDHFYGTGERGLSLDLKGQTFQNYNTQTYGYHTAQSVMNVNVPFIISSAGYGVLFDNTYPGQWDLGSADPSKWTYSASGGEMTYYFIAAENTASVLEKYTWLTGRQPLPPKWAFGFIQSKYGYQSAPEARMVVNTLREKMIPSDAIILDLYWFRNMGDISWNLNSWPDPHGMMQEFLNKGMKTIVITEPYITEGSSNFQEAVSKGYLAKNSQGNPYLLSQWWSCGCNAGLVDMTNPSAQSWWWSKHPAFMGSEMAGLWTDLGEPERHPSDMIHFGGSADKIHNIYNLLWAKAVFEGFASFRPGQRLFNLTRSGYAGIQRYGVITWSGDVGRSFTALSVQLPMLLNMGMSGLAYHNTDIGGFTNGTTTPELYIRWMQFGAFNPVMRAHGTGQPTEPWAFGEQAERISKKFIELRYRLQPYNYALAYENYLTGIPFARPLFFADPDFNLLSSISSAYLWGKSFIVSPAVFSNENVKTFYLPKGTWVDFWTDKLYNGGSYQAVPSPIESIALLVKAGSIIPMHPLMQFTGQIPADSLYLAVYPDQSATAEFTLYEDDGLSLGYQSGQRSVTTFTQRMDNSVGSSLILNVSRSEGTYSGKPAVRSYLPIVHLITTKPDMVRKNGTPLPEMSALQLVHSAEGFYYDSQKRLLHIHFRASADSSYEIAADNAHIITDISLRSTTIPQNMTLEQNFPNPFNPVTNIRFSVPVSGNAHFTPVSLKVFDIIGREVSTLVNESKAPGTYEVEFDAKGFPSGIYIYRLQAGGHILSRKMNLIK